MNKSKKGKYLSPSSKKLNFHPGFSEKSQSKSKVRNCTTFSRFERSMWKTAAAQNNMMDFTNIKKEIKRMWNMHNLIFNL
jgi:hypothetical protein